MPRDRAKSQPQSRRPFTTPVPYRCHHGPTRSVSRPDGQQESRFSMRTLAVAVIAFAATLVATAADARVVITVDKSTQRMTVVVDGVTRWNWPVSTGRRGHATPAGNFQAFRMEREHFSREWDDAPMPHSIFFTKRGHAIHGSLETRRLGSPASAGCIRLAPGNAAQLFALVEQRGVTNATVVITGEEPRGRVPAVATQTPQQKTAPRPPAPPTPRTARQAPRDEIYDIHGRPVGTPPVYRQPTYRDRLPDYDDPPPRYRYTPPPGYYDYYR